MRKLNIILGRVREQINKSNFVFKLQACVSAFKRIKEAILNRLAKLLRYFKTILKK